MDFAIKRRLLTCKYIKFTFQIVEIVVRMWHESRRQEKKVKGLIIDYQKRAERRKDHYEKKVRY